MAEAGKKGRIYISIDLKSFYASAECADRHLDPLTTNLVVADITRTEKTICLAVSSSLKAYGISGRARLFEVVQRVKQVNADRLCAYRKLIGDYKADFASESYDAPTLERDPSLKLSYIVAPPRMQRYEDVSSFIYSIYLKYIAPEDIIVYSIDEVFMDVTSYLPYYHMTAHELAVTMIREVLYTTGITATAGIGTNLYLAKVAMDIVAKHVPADKDGVRIAELDEISYRQKLWCHEPLTDFWRVGRGYKAKLEQYGMFTMGDVARCSIGRAPASGQPSYYYNERLLYDLFGVNAEILIDHAWGYEPCTVDVIKAYKPDTKSISSGQVLKEPYDYDKTRLIVREMTDLLVLDLVDKGLMTDQIVLTIGYDRESLTRPEIKYSGPTIKDHYGRDIPKHAHGTENLSRYSSSTSEIMEATLRLFDRIMNKKLLARRMNVVACHVLSEKEAAVKEAGSGMEQLDLFTDYDALAKQREADQAKRKKEHDLQLAMLQVKKKYGKNAVLKGMNFEDGGTTIERNGQIGGHKA